MRARPTALAVLAAVAALAAAAPAPGAPRASFVLDHARVVHHSVLFGGRPLALRFRFRSAEKRDIRVWIERLDDRRRAWHRVLRNAAPDATHKVGWDGLTDAGRAARDGRYRVLVGPTDGHLHTAARFVLHGHVFPVRGRHSTRGAIGRFGAPRSGGRTHEGFDIVADCGTPIVAARAGRVRKRAYSSSLYGNYLIVRSLLEGRDYWYAHLRSPPPFTRGDRVRTGQVLGRVGDTGNARTVGCHLHFEIHVGDRPIDPEPQLRAWDRWSPGR